MLYRIAMRKALAGLVAILALSLITAQLSVAAVTPGTKCSKAGATSSYNGKKYTCVKTGKKLVWNKGVAIKKPAVIAAPSATPSSAPSPTPSPTSSETAAPTPTPTPSPKILTPLEKLYVDIYSRYQAADKKISPSFNFVRCPNVNVPMADITESAYIDAYSFWVTIYKATAKVNWLLMSEQDWDCWYDTTAKFEGPNPISRSWKVWDKDTGVLGHCKVSPMAFCGYGTGVREGGIFAQYNMIGTKFTDAPTPLTVHHETVHNYQAQLIADNYSTSKVNTMACWFMEGQANLFGAPIASKGDPKKLRDSEIARLLKIYPNQGLAYTVLKIAENHGNTSTPIITGRFTIVKLP